MASLPSRAAVKLPAGSITESFTVPSGVSLVGANVANAATGDRATGATLEGETVISGLVTFEGSANVSGVTFTTTPVFENVDQVTFTGVRFLDEGNGLTPNFNGNTAKASLVFEQDKTVKINISKSYFGSMAEAAVIINAPIAADSEIRENTFATNGIIVVKSAGNIKIADNVFDVNGGVIVTGAAAGQIKIYGNAGLDGENVVSIIPTVDDMSGVRVYLTSDQTWELQGDLAIDQRPVIFIDSEKQTWPTEVSSVEDLYVALHDVNEFGGDAHIIVKQDLVLTETLGIAKEANVVLEVPKGITISGTVELFKTYGTLTIVGEGTIKRTGNTDKSSNIICVEGENGILNVTDVTIKTEGSATLYGVMIVDGGTVNVSGGEINSNTASAISSNNTTGGGNINVTGGKLYGRYYGIYMAAHDTVNISGGEVNGVNMRMGDLTVCGTGKITDPAISKDDYDDIGVELTTSGCIWFGDAIAVIAGSYKATEISPDVNASITIKDDATVETDFRAAIGIYKQDLKDTGNVVVNVESAANVTTSDEGYDAIKVYDHDYILERAKAAKKSYAPTKETNVTLNIG